MDSQTKFDARTPSQISWDLDTMVDQVWHSLHEEVDLLTICQTLVRILVKYIDVPVQTYIPIFAYREAVAELKK